VGKESIKRKRLEDAYIKYADRLYQVLLYYVKEECYLNDAVQESFLRFYDYMDKIEDEMVFAWLYHVGKNVLKRLYRRDSKLSVKPARPHSIQEAEEEVISAEEEYFEGDTYKEMRDFRNSVFDRLHKEYPLLYESLILVCVMEIPPKDAAKQLGVSSQVLHTRLHRARAWIHKHFKEECNEKFGKL